MQPTQAAKSAMAKPREHEPSGAEAKIPSLAPEFPLFGVRLPCRVGIGKSRDRHASVMDAHDPWIRVERKVEGLGGRYLSDQTNICDARPVAVAEDPA